jgi:hypothetical protein
MVHCRQRIAFQSGSVIGRLFCSRQMPQLSDVGELLNAEIFRERNARVACQIQSGGEQWGAAHEVDFNSTAPLLHLQNGRNAKTIHLPRLGAIDRAKWPGCGIVPLAHFNATR